MSKFKKEKTKEASFTIPGNMKVTTPMMYQKESFKHANFKNVEVIELPYARKALSMFVVLPHKYDGLKEVEKTLSEKQLKDWTSNLRARKIYVSLPKFKITWGTHDLVPNLKKLGMENPFDINKADFSGMTKEQICISLILHKAFVDVNEEGTEAAAATAVVITKNGGGHPTFQADHPFLFFIRDNKTGSILFMGRLENPAPSQKPVPAEKRYRPVKK